MREGFYVYWRSLFHDIPHELYLAGLMILIVLSVILVGMKGIRSGIRYSLGVLLAEYIALVYSSTVFFRAIRNRSDYDFTPFWSYAAYMNGKEPNALVENLANVIVFIPVGLLLGVAFRGVSWIKVLGIGCGTSVGIEMLQLIMKRGFCELDDVMHNTLGCLIGYGIYRLMYMCVISKTKRIYGK